MSRTPEADFNDTHSLEVYSGGPGQAASPARNRETNAVVQANPTPPRTLARPTFTEPDVPVSVNRDLTPMTQAAVIGDQEMETKEFLDC